MLSLFLWAFWTWDGAPACANVLLKQLGTKFRSSASEVAAVQLPICWGKHAISIIMLAMSCLNVSVIVQSLCELPEPQVTAFDIPQGAAMTAASQHTDAVLLLYGWGPGVNWVECCKGCLPDKLVTNLEQHIDRQHALVYFYITPKTLRYCILVLVFNNFDMAEDTGPHYLQNK